MPQDVTVQVKYTWDGPPMTLKEHSDWIQKLLSDMVPYKNFRCKPNGMATYEERIRDRT